MDFAFFIVLYLVLALVFWLLNWCIVRMAYPLDRRWHHQRIIIAVFLVLLLLTNGITVAFPLKLIDAIINSPFLGPILNTILPSRGFELEYMLLTIVLLNLLVTLLVLITVALVKVIFRRSAEENIGSVWGVAQQFYEDGENGPQLNASGFVAGRWAAGMKFAFIILWVLESLVLGGSILWGGEDWNQVMLSVSKAWYLAPMAGFLLAEQIQLFLEGVHEENAGSFGSSEIPSYVDGRNMPAIVRLYLQYFGGIGSLLYLEGGNKEAVSRTGMGTNDLGNQQVLDCVQPEVLKVLDNQLRESGVQKCDEFMNALVTLLNHKSINIRDNSEGEFLTYLASYLNYFLSQGKTALVLCDSDQAAEHMRDSLRERMERLNDLYSVWEICTGKEAKTRSRLTMVVCSYDDFLQQRILVSHAEFREDLFCVVIADGSDLMSRDGIRVEQIFHALRTLQRPADEPPLQYVVLSGADNDSLRTSVEGSIQQAGTELIPFKHDVRPENTWLMIWREESVYKVQRALNIGGDVSPYMGMALPLALVAAKYDLPKVFLIPSPDRGENSFREILTLSDQQVRRFLEKDLNLNDLLRFDPEEALERQDVSLMIAYDTEYNFCSELWKWMKYGGRYASLLHIISPPYLLRDYFAANMQKKQMLLRGFEFAAMVPHHSAIRETQLALLLVRLSDSGMTEEELMAESRRHGWEYETAEELLTACLLVVLRPEEQHSVYSCFSFVHDGKKVLREDTDTYADPTVITLTDENIRRRLLEQVRYADFVSKKSVRTQLPILRGNLLNYYLPGQQLVSDGYLYQIQEIRDGTVYAEQDLPSSLYTYYPISDFTFTDYTLINPCVDLDVVDMNMCRTSVRRRIYGYLASNNGNRFAGRDCINAMDLRGKGLVQEDNGSSILELNFRRDALGDNAEGAAMLAAFMIREISKTLFPSTWQNLHVVTEEPMDETGLGFVLEKLESCPVEDLARCVIPWMTARPDAPRPEFVTIYVVELSCLEFGMVQTLYDHWEQLFGIIREYLYWYLGKEDVPEPDPEPNPEQAAEAMSWENPRAVEEMEVTEDSDAVPRAEAASEETEALHEETETPAESEKQEKTAESEPLPETPVVSPEYLHFGFSEIPVIFAPEELLTLCDRILPKHEQIDVQTAAEPEANLTCTFCGSRALFLHHLADGREMCNDCKNHQLTQRGEIKNLYLQTVQYMTQGYSIRLRERLHIRFKSAEEIRAVTGTPIDGRVLGFYSPKTHQLWIEGRGPRISMQATLAHELTHVWQYDNLPLRRLRAKLPKATREQTMLRILEGHAVYVEIDVMRRLHENNYADFMHALSMLRKDEYGIGYRWIKDLMEAKQSEGSYKNAFYAMLEIAEDIIAGKVAPP